MVELEPLSPEQKSLARMRLVEEDEDKEVISSLSLCYKMFIAPVYDLLEEPEVIIVPDAVPDPSSGHEVDEEKIT